MEKSEHKKRHEELHKALDELVADFLTHTGALLTPTSIMDLMDWSYRQTQDPEEIGDAKMDN